jgi:serine acetyltransferase
MSTSPSCRQIDIDTFVNNKPMLGLIDIGSGVTIGDSSVIGDNLVNIVPVNIILVGSNGQKLNLLGKVEIELKKGALHKQYDILIANDLPKGTLILFGL